MEQNHDTLVKDVANLAGTVSRVELNQQHADEMNKLRFNALDTALSGLTTQLVAFISRVEGIITGEIQTTQTKQGAEILVEYQRWRGTVEERLDKHDKFETQGRLLARIGLVLVSTNVLAVIVAIAAAVNAFNK